MSDAARFRRWWAHSKVPVVLSLVVAWLVMGGLAVWADVPTFEGDAAAVLTQPGAVGNVLVVVLGLAGCVAVGSLVCRGMGDVGWACGVAGLVAVALRGGTMRQEMIGRGAGQWLVLLAELLLWAGVVVALWLVGRRLAGGEAGGGVKIAGEEDEVSQKLIGSAVALLSSAVVAGFLAKGFDVKQGLFAALVGGFVGGWVGARFVPARPGIWLWLPAAVGPGVVGYVAAFLGGDPVLGEAGGYVPTLGRVSPLMWVAAGVPAAAWGYRSGLIRKDEVSPEVAAAGS